LKDEIADTKNGISDQSSSEDEASDEKPYPDAENFLLGNQISSKKLTGAHPSPVHIFRLWQTFLINVHPLIMMFHAPTVQQLVLDATANLDAVPRPVEALMFSIYLLAVESLNDGACEAMFGESKVALIRKYSHAAQQALINSKFLKSLNLYTLQAYICYIVSAFSILITYRYVVLILHHSRLEFANSTMLTRFGFLPVLVSELHNASDSIAMVPDTKYPYSMPK
jgi:hypothetical protein